MDCPECSVEMAQLEVEGNTIQSCPECQSMWIDIADLNRLLLHHNLPTLETIGGHANPDEPSVMCPEDQVDLVVIEGGDKRSLAYQTCEVCGGTFLETDAESTQDAKAAVDAIVGFYKRFMPKKGAAKGA